MKEKEVNITAVILLQIVMVSPGTHFVKNRESQSRISESQLKKKKKKKAKLKMLWPSCNQTVNLQRTPKLFAYYSILKLKYCPSTLKHNKG